jgi:hypothetical protein
MTTINRTIETEQDRTMAARLIEARAVPFTFTLTDGKHRTTAQNKLQRLWMNEIAEQKGDMKPEEVRAYCKLTIGVPILRAQNEAFRIRYDEVVKPLPYEQKIAFMSEPLDLPITRIMTTRQKTEYLDGIIRHFAEQGIVLTMPDDLRDQHSNPSEVVAPSSDEGSGGPQPSPDAQTVAAAQPMSQNSASIDEGKRDKEPAEAADPEAGEPEAADSQSAAPASDLITPADRDWLKLVVKMLWAATGIGEQDVLKNQMAGIRENLTPETIGDQARAKANSINTKCKLVCFGEASAADVLALIAGIAGCDVKDVTT